MSKIKANTIENVAGTATHDVATMGIESGSNANGHWTKFPDGTMIQWNIITVTDQAIDDAYGTLFQGTRDITFPQPFIEAPSASCGIFREENGAGWGSIRNTTETLIMLRGMDVVSRTIGNTIEISWQAIGRWK